MTDEPHKTGKASDSKVSEDRLAKSPIPPESSAKTSKPKKLTRKELEQALEGAQAQIEKQKTRLAYLQADHDNYVKSMERHTANLRLQANHDLILTLLPILDDLERAQIMVPQIEVNTPFLEGFSMLVENLKTVLMNAGVKPIECEGKTFDPLRHEVVVREESTEIPANTVIKELRKGYLLKGTLLRPSMVKIAVAPKPIPKKSETEESEDNESNKK
ncbi:MAG: nucleotide exchange factor GrpE [Promethearchaeota archaeon]